MPDEPATTINPPEPGTLPRTGPPDKSSDTPAPWDTAHVEGNPADQRVYTIREAAARCGVSRKVIERRIERDTLQSLKGSDGKRRVPHTELLGAGLIPEAAPASLSRDLTNIRAERDMLARQVTSLTTRLGAERSAAERLEASLYEERALRLAAEQARMPLGARIMARLRRRSTAGDPQQDTTPPAG